jgi:hypothetical protein
MWVLFKNILFTVSNTISILTYGVSAIAEISVVASGRTDWCGISMNEESPPVVEGRFSGNDQRVTGSASFSPDRSD